MNTVYGILCDSTGLASKTVAVQGARRPELRFQAWATPSDQVRSVQDEKIPIDLDHSGIPVGEVVHLERRAGNLWCVGHVDDHVTPAVHVKVAGELVTLDHPLYWSAERIGGPDLGILFTSVALTASPARISPQPVQFLDGGLDFRSVAKERWHLRNFDLELLTRAADTRYRRRTSPLEPLVVYDPMPRIADHHQRFTQTRPIEVRSVTALEVHRSRRELDLLVAPAEVPTVIHERSRSFVEVYAHGCFAGCEHNPEKIKVNRDHERTRTIGKALALDPWDEEGLTATVRLAKVADADEALALVDEQLLGVSAGFAIDSSGEEWHGTKQRRVKKALLDHIALTPAPAYETANVLAARGHELTQH